MKNLLSSTAFIVLNKQLARQIGLKEAVLLADLISKEEYFIANGMTDGWFFNTESNIEEDTTLNSYHQRKCLKTLKKEGLVEVKRKGIPAKQYFKINSEQVLQILNNLSDKNLTTINNNKQIKIKNKYFIKPTEKQVKNYCSERNNNVDYKAFIDFYESKDWKIGKNKMKDWKAAVRTWERREVKKPTKMSKLDSQINAWHQAKKLL
jgi:DNA-binding PadR family transcriptional regulator|tara:strand:- start:967 stop:1587 length:621 start_codon:yes stop_codon:yes gene_type:complete